MALTNTPVLPQEPKSGGVAFGASSESTSMDPSGVSPTTLLTAGADGSLVTDVTVTAETTVTAEKFVLWKQLAGAGDWYVVTTAVLDAYTQSASDVQGTVKLIDKASPTAAIRLAATDVLGVTHHVDQQSIVSAEYTDY